MSVVSGTVTQKLDFSQTRTGVPTPYGMIAQSGNLTRSYGNGTAAGNVNLQHCASYSLVAAPQTLDLTALPDLQGANQAFARVREFFLHNTSGFPLFVGNAAATAWAVAQGPFTTATGVACVPPGGIYQWSDPSTVGAGNGGVVDATHKSLKLDPGANTVTFDLIVEGCDALS